MSSDPPTYSLYPISTPEDLKTLTHISLTAVANNFLHNYTYPPSVNTETLFNFHYSTAIDLPDEGDSMQTIKIIDDATGQIVAFSSWLWSQKKIRKSSLGKFEGADMRLRTAFEVQTRPIIEAHCDQENDIKLFLMRVLPEYKNKGLGGMMMRWGLAKAEALGKRVFLLASEEGRWLYEKYGFRTVGTATMGLKDFGGEGVYVQRVMIWTPEGRNEKTKEETVATVYD